MNFPETKSQMREILGADSRHRPVTARPAVAGEQLGFTRQRNFLRPADLFPGWFESPERLRQDCTRHWQTIITWDVEAASVRSRLREFY